MAHRKSMVRIFVLCLTATFGLWPADLSAQRGRGQRPPGAQGQQGPQGQARRAELQRQIQQRFTTAMREQLDLDDEGMRAVGEVLDRFQRRRREVARERQNARTRVRVLGREEIGGAELTEDSAQAALDNLLRVTEAESQLFAEEQAALLEILTPVQVLRLQQLREQVAERMRGVRGGPGPPGGGLEVFPLGWG